jgi:hypothetical protein
MVTYNDKNSKEFQEKPFLVQGGNGREPQPDPL